MRSTIPRILIVEPDPAVLEILVAGFTRRFDAYLTCVDSGESCLDVEITDSHDLILSELRLPDDDGLPLLHKLSSLSAAGRPMLVLADRPSPREIIQAMRAGARDVFRKPFPLRKLLDRAEVLLNEYSLKRRQHVKYHRMRDLVRRVLRERRELDRRTEFICRDLVAAHRRLVHRFLANEASTGRETS